MTESWWSQKRSLLTPPGGLLLLLLLAVSCTSQQASNSGETIDSSPTESSIVESEIQTRSTSHEATSQEASTEGTIRFYEPVLNWTVPGDPVPEFDDLGLTVLAPTAVPLGQQVDVELEMSTSTQQNPLATVVVRGPEDQLISVDSSQAADQGFSCADRGDGIWAETSVRGFAACELQTDTLYALRWVEGGSSFLYSSASLMGKEARTYLNEWGLVSSS